MYNSYIKFANDRGIANPGANKKINKTFRRIQRVLEVSVDPLFGVKSLNDDEFIGNYEKKWGIDKKLFTPRISKP